MSSTELATWWSLSLVVVVVELVDKLKLEIVGTRQRAVEQHVAALEVPMYSIVARMVYIV